MCRERPVRARVPGATRVVRVATYNIHAVERQAAVAHRVLIVPNSPARRPRAGVPARGERVPEGAMPYRGAPRLHALVLRDPLRGRRRPSAPSAR